MNWLLLAGSLAGVLVLAAAAWALGLGGDPKIADEAEALRIAADHGFEGTIATVQDEGRKAIVGDAEGRITTIRRHGVHFIAGPDA